MSSQAEMQSRFRVNPQKPYSQRMSETRSEIRQIIKEMLRAITNDNLATMHYPTFFENVVERYRVVLEGWPEDIPFRNLSDVSNLNKLETLLEGWRSGRIRFRRISDQELEQLRVQHAAELAANAGIMGQEVEEEDN